MDRRKLLKSMILGCSAMAISPIRLIGRYSAEQDLEFYVAGVRFCRIHAILHEGDVVNLRWERSPVGGSWAIYNESGQQVGYVPKRLLPQIGALHQSRGRVSFADAFAVPWKRYKVTVTQS